MHLAQNRKMTGRDMDELLELAQDGEMSGENLWSSGLTHSRSTRQREREIVPVCKIHLTAHYIRR